MTKEFRPIPLKLKTPVPSDIEIAQDSDLKPIFSCCRGTRFVARRDRILRSCES
jgi:hypothetical protein